jgi:hypothetical protein
MLSSDDALPPRAQEVTFDQCYCSMGSIENLGCIFDCVTPKAYWHTTVEHHETGRVEYDVMHSFGLAV